MLKPFEYPSHSHILGMENKRRKHETKCFENFKMNVKLILLFIWLHLSNWSSEGMDFVQWHCYSLYTPRSNKIGGVFVRQTNKNHLNLCSDGIESRCPSVLFCSVGNLRSALDIYVCIAWEKRVCIRIS